MTVTGIGGVFLRSKDPNARAEWYREHLGIAAGHDEIWRQHEGMTIFAPFAESADYFPASETFMLNLRVTDLDALIVRLEAAGIAVEQRDEWRTEYGNFARISDPVLFACRRTVCWPSPGCSRSVSAASIGGSGSWWPAAVKATGHRLLLEVLPDANQDGDGLNSL